MSAQPLDVSEVLFRFAVEIDATLHHQCWHALELAQAGQLPQAVEQARAVLRESLRRNAVTEQAIACAYLAAIYAERADWPEAQRQAHDCYRMFHQRGDAHNAQVARALLAVVYQKQLDAVSRALIDSLGTDAGQPNVVKRLPRGRDDAGLSREDDVLPVVGRIPPGPYARSPNGDGYLIPVLLVSKPNQENRDEPPPPAAEAAVDVTQYAIQPLPTPREADPVPAARPAANDEVAYTAIKIDPDSARQAGFEPDDYLLVRGLTSADVTELRQRAGVAFTGWYFEVAPGGAVEFVNAVPPKFVSEENVQLRVAQVAAILRRAK